MAQLEPGHFKMQIQIHHINLGFSKYKHVHCNIINHSVHMGERKTWAFQYITSSNTNGTVQTLDK